MKENVSAVLKRINETALACGRNPETIRLVAVSKTMGADRAQAAVEAGIGILGENYIQEALEKIEKLKGYDVSWHFIGHLQTNKAKSAVAAFELIHTVDSLKLAREIDKQAARVSKTQDILIQVNIGNEPTKSGIDPKEAQALIQAACSLDHLRIRGVDGHSAVWR